MGTQRNVNNIVMAMPQVFQAHYHDSDGEEFFDDAMYLKLFLVSKLGKCVL